METPLTKNIRADGEVVDLAAYEKYLGGTLEDYEYPAEKVREALAALPRR